MAGVWWACVVAAVVGQAGSSLAWGNSLCNLMHQDKEWLQQLTEQTERQVNETVSALEDKLDTIMTFVEDVRKAEQAWITLDTNSDTVERDLTGMEEETTVMRKEHITVTEEESKEVSEDKGETVAAARMDDEEKEDQELQENQEKGEMEENDQGPKKGECMAQVMDNHETIGLFFMTTYNHGHCANRQPLTVPVRYCFGYCLSQTFIEREVGIWSQGHHCHSCQPATFETIRVPLTCDDHFTFQKTFQNVVDCRCRKCQPGSKRRPG